jgi:hypothetical protein
LIQKTDIYASEYLKENVMEIYLLLVFQGCSMRRVNEMVKRIRLAVVHICVLGTLRSKMPFLWGKETTQAKLIENLQQVGFPYRY